jgi:L-asparaginase II
MVAASPSVRSLPDDLHRVRDRRGDQRDRRGGGQKQMPERPDVLAARLHSILTAQGLGAVKVSARIPPTGTFSSRRSIKPPTNSVGERLAAAGHPDVETADCEPCRPRAISVSAVSEITLSEQQHVSIDAAHRHRMVSTTDPATPSRGHRRAVMSASSSRPRGVAVLVRRGDRVESWHRVAFAVADAAGVVRHADGDALRPVFPRSAVKPLQALALLESGAAERFAVSQAEVALACASHGGEPFQVDPIRRWLARLGLDATALECGAHPPTHGPSAERLVAAGESPEPVHNNCSGKHTAMLTVARHLGAPVAGYIRPDHPVQRRVAAILAEMAGVDPLPEPATDGCGLPTYPLTLVQLATAMARLADPKGLSPARAAACRKICAAMTSHSELVAGSGRPCTAIMSALPDVIVKSGAEGVDAAALPKLGLGLALKVEDGAARAAPVALLALFEGLGLLPAKARATLANIARPTLRNHARTIVGRIDPAPGWPGF